MSPINSISRWKLSLKILPIVLISHYLFTKVCTAIKCKTL